MDIRERARLVQSERVRDGEKHVELCLDAGQAFYSLALFSVDMYFRANVTLFHEKKCCKKLKQTDLFKRAAV